MRNLNDKIPGAPNFKYKEFVKSITAKRYDILNIPTNEKIWFNIENLAVNVLQPIRDKFGPILILSGYRSQKLNSKIGGSVTSNHCRGEAADIEPIDLDIPMIEIVNFINEELKYRWLILEYFPDGWIHIDYREENNIEKIKLKDDDTDYEIVSLTYVNDKYNYV